MNHLTVDGLRSRSKPIIEGQGVLRLIAGGAMSFRGIISYMKRAVGGEGTAKPVEIGETVNVPERDSLYWASFRATDDSFIGVVICRGKSPGAAANYAITKGIVESEKATIVMIPASRESQLETFVDRLIGEEEARKLLLVLDIPAVER